MEHSSSSQHIGINQAAQVVCVHTPVDGQRKSFDQVERLATFYGLDMPTFEVGAESDTAAIWAALRQKRTVAAILTAEALAVVDRRQLIAASLKDGSESIPLLIVNLSAETAPELLMQWTDHAVTRCDGPVMIGANSMYSVGMAKDVTRQLSGQSFIARAGHTYTLLVDSSKTQLVIELVADSAKRKATFVTTRVGSHRVFLSAGSTVTNTPLPRGAYDQAEYHFSTTAPLHMFLSYAAGERAWHSNGHYANLTVDDPLLREPYGHLRYAELLRHMREHNFHTTIAHIPWNFDRSKPDVVALFKANQNRFSVTVHGNNHDHQEFPSLGDRPLEVQTANIRQALARMEQFQAATGLPYDRVMVFPHCIAPEATLAALKKYNYVATANSRNVPLGSPEPDNSQFPLRPTTLAFANFLTIRRYSAEMPLRTVELAINAFLGNPILFYVHQHYFAEGIDRFNATADVVNGLEPNTIWSGLGEIARHSYLKRLREDGDYDVKAFTSDLHLENTCPKNTTFFIQKEEDFTVPFRLFVDGVKHPYSRNGSSIEFEVSVDAGMSRRITITYQDTINVGNVEISRASVRVAALRYLSEFRDNVVSRSTAGRILIKRYTNIAARFTRSLRPLSAFAGILVRPFT